MASTFTTNLRLELQGSGENRASWGARANTVFTLIDEAIAAMATVTVADSATATELTHLDSQSDQSRKMILKFTGALTADRTVTTQAVSKTYVVNNATTGGKNVVFKTDAVGATSVSIAPGAWKYCWTDGSTMYTNDSMVTFSSASQRWTITATVDATGIMETGRYIDFHNANVDATDYAVRLDTGGTTTDLYVTASTGTPPLLGQKVWHAGNDGAGSGMDADLLDGLQAIQILVPTGTVVDYAGTTAPTGWLLCNGQVVSTTTYANLFAVLGTTYGGNGTTTFGVPDLRGRVAVGKDDMGGTSAGRITGSFGSLLGNTLGDAGGAESMVQALANMPSHAHTQQGTFSDVSTGISANHTHTQQGSFTSGNATANHTHDPSVTSNAFVTTGGASGGQGTTGSGFTSTATTSASGAAHQHSTTISGQTGNVSSDHTHTVAITISGSTTSQGSSTAHSLLQPSMILNKIIKT